MLLLLRVLQRKRRHRRGQMCAPKHQKSTGCNWDRQKSSSVCGYLRGQKDDHAKSTISYYDQFLGTIHNLFAHF